MLLCIWSVMLYNMADSEQLSRTVEVRRSMVRLVSAMACALESEWMMIQSTHEQLIPIVLQSCIEVHCLFLF